MLDSERNSNETDNNEATGRSAGAAPAPVTPAVPAALFQPPQVLFQPPAPLPSLGTGDRDSGNRESGGKPESDADSGRTTRRSRSARPQGGDVADDQAGPDAEGGRVSRRTRSARPQGGDVADDQAESDAEGGRTSRRTRSRGRSARVRDAAGDDDLFSAESAGAVAEAYDADTDATVAAGVAGTDEAEEPGASRRRRRRNTRTRGRAETAADDDVDGQGGGDDSESDDSGVEADDDGEAAGGEAGALGRRRRRKRRRGSADGDVLSPDDPPDTVVHVREPHNPADDVRAIKGSTRLEAKKQRRREGRESGRRRPPVITESEFLARRESVERTMVVRQRGDRTQIAVLEDGVLVEHYVNRTTHASYVGNVYLGKVQNVLPSMEAAFVDIGKGRNAVLYAGEVNFDASGLEGQPKRIESALKPGQSVIVQVTKDPVGHKGARLTSQVSLPGRYLVYVPGASMTGISRKLPDTERTRLKQILKKVTPENAGVIVRTAAEGAAEAELDRDITRLAAQWENIEKKAKTASAPALLYGEPDLTIRVVRDVFNEDFHKLIVSGDEGWEIIDEYVRYVAPHLADRISRWDTPENEDAAEDVFAAYRIDEQLAKALERKVWLPSGGSLVIDRTEAMTVIDVNTGKFTGQGGNLEETVTRNNLEAAEEIVRQLRLRDVGGIVVIDFIDMVLESNRELILRRLLECLARDRTKHQVAEVTSLGLVQMTRKRVGAGLLEAFSTPCECCNGRGVIVTLDAPAEPAHRASAGTTHRPVPAPPAPATGNGNGAGNGKGQGNGSGNAKAGFSSGRRGNRRDDDRRDDERDARDSNVGSAQDTATQAASQVDAPQTDALQLGAVQPDIAQSDTARSDTARTGAADGAPSDNGTAKRDDKGAPRTRRSTSAGTAFATAVLVDDSEALVPVVATVPPVTDLPSAGSTSAATSDTSPETTSTPPVRRTRTRAGSAVARVTVVTDPEPAPASEAEPAPAAVATEVPAPVTDSAATATATADASAATADTALDTAAATTDPAVQPVTEAPAPAGTAEASTDTAPAVPAEVSAPVADTAGTATDTPAWATEAPAPTTDTSAPVTEAPAPVTESSAPAAEAFSVAAEAPAPATEAAPAAEPERTPEPESAAKPLGEPTIVSASLFEAPAAAPSAEPSSPAEPEPVAATTAPATEPTQVAAEPDAAGEPAPEAAVQAAAASEPVQAEPVTEAAPAVEGSVEPVQADAAGEPAPEAPAQAELAPEPARADAEGEPTPTEATPIAETGTEAEGEAPTWA